MISIALLIVNQGLHWHVAIIRMLQNQSTEHKPYDAFYLHKHRASFLSQQPSPRLLTTHVPFRYLPKQAFEKKIKIVYLNRNPKDVIVSYFSHRASNSGQMHYPGTFEQFYYLLLEVGYHHGHIFDNLLQFQEGQDSMPDVPIYTSMFEDMKTDPAQGVKNLNQYLGTGCSDALCEEIAEACQFRNLQPAKEGDPPGFDENEFKNGTPTFYRKGELNI
ncbi:sulfotransferase family cytosolic 1B member 1-like [Aplysia californica]|uniref:Sulfotransferase family cytosolic 1B member 1-like n=1 Tax=Aplysia californica TaxID=6500 RepID=A0ABM0JVG1_APLCA|nr:sulfotransferase family cytosolic 1B member 1-like [Aplysia californica]